MKEIKLVANKEMLEGIIITIRELRTYAYLHQENTNDYWMMMQSADIMLENLQSYLQEENVNDERRGDQVPAIDDGLGPSGGQESVPTHG